VSARPSSMSTEESTVVEPSGLVFAPELSFWEEDAEEKTEAGAVLVALAVPLLAGQNMEERTEALEERMDLSGLTGLEHMNPRRRGVKS
jgi:hypothetical protein